MHFFFFDNIYSKDTHCSHKMKNKYYIKTFENSGKIKKSAFIMSM